MQYHYAVEVPISYIHHSRAGDADPDWGGPFCIIESRVAFPDSRLGRDTCVTLVFSIVRLLLRTDVQPRLHAFMSDPLHVQSPDREAPASFSSVDPPHGHARHCR